MVHLGLGRSDPGKKSMCNTSEFAGLLAAQTPPYTEGCIAASLASIRICRRCKRRRSNICQSLWSEIDEIFNIFQKIAKTGVGGGCGREFLLLTVSLSSHQVWVCWSVSQTVDANWKQVLVASAVKQQLVELNLGVRPVECVDGNHFQL